MVRILITGSRSWADPEQIRMAILDILENTGTSPEDALIVHGDCPSGADYMASVIAEHEGIPQERHPADWKGLGRKAGFVRNAEMVKLGADVCLAFINNGSAGATMTANTAIKAGIPTKIIVNDDSGVAAEADDC